MGNTDARENFAGEVNFPRDNDFAERAIFP